MSAITRRQFLTKVGAGSALLLVPQLAWSHGYPLVARQASRAEAGDSVVLLWNEAALQGVRDSRLGPPIVARALAVVHTCVYDAWAAYDGRAIGTRFGAALGDVGLMAFDDPARQKVFLRVIHPSIVSEVDLDPEGNCKGYVFEEWRPDPREIDPLIHPQLVKYNEVASRVGGRILDLLRLRVSKQL